MQPYVLLENLEAWGYISQPLQLTALQKNLFGALNSCLKQRSNHVKTPAPLPKKKTPTHQTLNPKQPIPIEWLEHLVTEESRKRHQYFYAYGAVYRIPVFFPLPMSMCAFYKIRVMIVLKMQNHHHTSDICGTCSTNLYILLIICNDMRITFKNRVCPGTVPVFSW